MGFLVSPWFTLGCVGSSWPVASAAPSCLGSGSSFPQAAGLLCEPGASRPSSHSPGQSLAVSAAKGRVCQETKEEY